VSVGLFLVSQTSSVYLQLIAAVSHDVIISWYVTHIHLTLLILILFPSPSAGPFLNLWLDVLASHVLCRYVALYVPDVILIVILALGVIVCIVFLN
jgi:hypothetical protein